MFAAAKYFTNGTFFYAGFLSTTLSSKGMLFLKDLSLVALFRWFAIFLVFGAKTGYIITYYLSVLLLELSKCLDFAHYAMEYLPC